MYGVGQAAEASPHVLQVSQRRHVAVRRLIRSRQVANLPAYGVAVASVRATRARAGACAGAGSPDGFRPAVSQASSWARLLDSSRKASAWASMSLAFCSTVAMASA